MHATPNQHLLALPCSPVGKSSDLHAGVQQFKSHSGHKFFFLHIITHLVATHSPISDSSFYLVCRYLEKKKKKVHNFAQVYTLSTKAWV